ncbi:MAG: SsrA-binding protein, partial [Planctomycetota bacterium]|nr:SsrA-binding protein [Planctomycetota bacterium]
MPEKERPITDVALNRKARRNYEILEKLEVGIALSGTEVKTLRNGQISLDESFVKLEDDGLWLIG